MQQQQLATKQVASRDPKAELTCALRNSSGHQIQARHHLIVITGQRFKGLADHALDALDQVFVAEDPGVRLAQPAADRHAGHEGPVRAAPAARRTLTTASYIRRIHLHFGYVAPKPVICAALYNKTLTLHPRASGQDRHQRVRNLCGRGSQDCA